MARAINTATRGAYSKFKQGAEASYNLIREEYGAGKWLLRNASEKATQRVFASNYAQGGISSVMFANSPREAFGRAMSSKARTNSSEHIRNLRKLSKANPDSTSVKKALGKALQGNAAGKIGPGAIGKTFGGVLGAAFIALPMITTEGPLEERARAGTAGIGATIGAGVGWKLGSAIGAAAGTALGPLGTGAGYVVGGIIGTVAGSVLGDIATDAITRLPDAIVDKERNRRKLSWGNDNSAFMTRSAHTMRQQSLQAMNSGMMSARSMLGREGVMLHQ